MSQIPATPDAPPKLDKPLFLGVLVLALLASMIVRYYYPDAGHIVFTGVCALAVGVLLYFVP